MLDIANEPYSKEDSTSAEKEDTVTSMVVNFRVKKFASQLTGKTLRLEAEEFNKKGKVTY